MLLQEEINKIIEMIDSRNVICEMCGHSWNIENGDKEPYLCHQCAYDNKKGIFDIKANEKFWRSKSNLGK